MANFNFGGAPQRLAPLWNFDNPSEGLLTGASSRLDSETKSDLRELWRADPPSNGLQNSFNSDFPADERNMTTKAINPSEHTTIPISRWRKGWEKSLQLGQLGFAVLRSAGQDNNSMNVVMCTLPVVNWTLQVGQLAAAARVNRLARDNVNYLRQLSNFTDGELFPDGTDQIPNAAAQVQRLQLMMSVMGVVQYSTGIGPHHMGSTTTQPRTSIVVNGGCQTHHLWGTNTPGTRLFLAYVRMARNATHGSFATAGEGAQHWPEQHGEGSGTFANTHAELEPFPFVLVPCWTTTQLNQSAGSDRYTFHPAHRTAISAAKDMVRGRARAAVSSSSSSEEDEAPVYISIGVLTHPPHYRPSASVQTRAPFDAAAMAELPLATISFSTAPVC
jgi:hypothetical protein